MRSRLKGRLLFFVRIWVGKKAVLSCFRMAHPFVIMKPREASGTVFSGTHLSARVTRWTLFCANLLFWLGVVKVAEASSGRTMQGWVRADSSAFGDDVLRRKLLDAALTFVRALLPK